jgi:hypothetical protein
MYRLQGLECFGNMFLRGELGEKDVTDNPLPIDDVRHSSWQPKCCRYTVELSEQAIRVAQQDKGELVRGSEPLMRFYRV